MCVEIPAKHSGKQRSRVRDETPNGSARSLARRESSVREFVRSPDATEYTGRMRGA